MFLMVGEPHRNHVDASVGVLGRERRHVTAAEQFGDERIGRIGHEISLRLPEASVPPSQRAFSTTSATLGRKYSSSGGENGTGVSRAAMRTIGPSRSSNASSLMMDVI